MDKPTERPVTLNMVPQEQERESAVTVIDNVNKLNEKMFK